ncbi:MAG TPA: hypothetical protein VLF88_00145 [Candidatus Babeliales bacterium]|nr:hypothetical protein [Candidatus Babeliales bacterium]
MLKFRRLFLLLLLLFAGFVISQKTAAAQSVYPSGSTGSDVSYPNCSALVPKSSFGIVGVNGGSVYSYNGCLAKEASHYTNLSLYINTGWYDQSLNINPNSPRTCSAEDKNCLAYNYGFNAATQAVNYAKNQGVNSSTWWLDVETMNTWNSDTAQNQNSLQGSYDALKSNSATTIGAYSTTAQWQTITGGWKNGWPNWGATTWDTAKQAAKYCTGHQFTGGPTLLIQFNIKKLDQDYAC